MPDDLRYTENDEWVRCVGEVCRVGITDYAQGEMTDIVYVELPEVGTDVEAGSPFGVVESVKAASEVYAPVSGKVMKVNEAVADNPELINKDPYGEGWLIEIAPSDISEIERLMSADEYKKSIESR